MKVAAELLDDERAEIPWQAAEALASWDRTLAGADRSDVAKLFVRAATEIFRLAGRKSEPEAWQQLVDDTHAMGRRYGLEDAVVQTLLQAATLAPPDHRPMPDGPEAYGLPIDSEPDQAAAEAPPLQLVSPAAWRGVALPPHALARDQAGSPRATSRSSQATAVAARPRWRCSSLSRLPGPRRLARHDLENGPVIFLQRRGAGPTKCAGGCTASPKARP